MTTAKSPLYKLNNGIEMPALGFRSEPEETVAAVRSAVADGYRLVGAAAAQAGAALGKTPTLTARTFGSPRHTTRYWEAGPVDGP